MRKRHFLLSLAVILALLTIFIPAKQQHLPPVFHFTMETIVIPKQQFLTQSEWKKWSHTFKSSFEHLSKKASLDLQTLNHQKAPKVWTIALNAYQDEKTAAGIAKQLQQQHFKAYFRQVQSTSASWVVYVGPEIDHKQTQKVLDELQQQYGIEGKLIRYP